MFYFDTCFLAPLLREEPTSSRVEKFIGQLPTGTLWVSSLVRLEFFSLIARDVRMEGVSPAKANEIGRGFDEMISDTYRVIVPTGADYERAMGYVRRFDCGLRSGDALHLAIAVNHGAETLLTFDKGLIKAGKKLGVNVSSI